MACRPRYDVGRHREREAETERAAQHHQDQFEPVQRAPFQMALPLQHELVGDGHRVTFDRAAFRGWPGMSRPSTSSDLAESTWRPCTRPGMRTVLTEPRGSGS